MSPSKSSGSDNTDGCIDPKLNSISTSEIDELGLVVLGLGVGEDLSPTLCDVTLRRRLKCTQQGREHIGSIEV